jgi:uncharacterized protein YkwD
VSGGNPSFRFVYAIAVAMVVLALLPAAAAASPGSRLLSGINQARQANGLPALRYSPNLSASAGRYSRYMVAHNYFGHLSRIHASWSRWSWLGENLAMYPGWGTHVGSIVRSWLRSPPHRQVMLSARYRFAGAGYAHGRMGGRRATTVTLQVGRAK